uniref:Uncharacterized protein n=1 Tax=Romanomermis culicivorax TaxID=13658 RepID=A0A915HME4_ROMCU
MDICVCATFDKVFIDELFWYGRLLSTTIDGSPLAIRVLVVVGVTAIGANFPVNTSKVFCRNSATTLKCHFLKLSRILERSGILSTLIFSYGSGQLIDVGRNPFLHGADGGVKKKT